MKISISYRELSELAFKKTGKNIIFEFCGQKEKFVAKIASIPCYITLMNVDSRSVTFSHRIGSDSPDIVDNQAPASKSFLGGFLKRGLQSLGQTAVNAIIEKYVNHPAVSVNDDKSLTVSLDKIPQLSHILDKVELNDICFDADGAIIHFALK